MEKYTADGDLTIHTQTAYLLPLAFDMVPDAWMTTFVERLRERVVQNDYTLSTGFVGTGILCQTLAKVGLHDLCYSLLLQTKDPSWLYSVRQGATTVWERWNSYTKARGFGDVGMNSFNHYAYGAVAEWLFGGMCGILPDPKAPGFKHFLLAPTPDMRETLPAGQKSIGSAKATYRSCEGLIESGWAYVEGGYNYDFVIPQGTTAEVSLIAAKDVLLFNDLAVSARELSATRIGDRLVFTLPAGRYSVRVD
jgi:alpha-L-rhamnosidase